MVGESSPTHELCPRKTGKDSLVDNALDAAGYSIGYGDCGDGSSTASSILLPLIIPCTMLGLLMLSFAVLVAWARRRHGGLRRYINKKLADFKRFSTRFKADFQKSGSVTLWGHYY
jgi:hypothetical protein